MANILVTGANGFVGKALVAKLVQNDLHVNAAVRRESGLRQEFVVSDLGPHTDWTQALHGCEIVIHLAARVHVMHDTAENPLVEFRVANADGTANLAQQAARAGVKRFIFMSSVKVNGEQSMPGHPFTADDEPAPGDAYGLSKLEAERELRTICAKTGMDYVVIRPSLVYGPGVSGNFQTLMRWTKRGVPLPLGAIKNCRSFIALENLVDLIIACLDKPAATNQTFMAADGENVSTTELLVKLSRAYGRKPRLIPIPASWLRGVAAVLGKTAAADRLLGSLVVDATRTRHVLNWTPVISMDEQLGKIVRDDSRS